MNIKKVPRTLTQTAFLMACMLLPAWLGAQNPSPVPLDTGKLQEILGPDASQWLITPLAYAHINDQGQPALFPGKAQTLNLENKTVYPVGTEYTLTCRLIPQKGRPAFIAMFAGCAQRPDKTIQYARLSLSGAGGQEYITYNCSIPDKQFKPITGILHLAGTTDHSLAWPDDLRRIVEAQMAAEPKLEEMIFTLRCSIEAGRIRAWLNGRFVGEIALPEDMSGAGTFRIQLPDSVQLLSARTRELPVVSRRFEPLLIDENLTGAAIGGRKIDHVSLPAPGQEAMVDGLPFYFPATDIHGNDHIDVGTSWTRFGVLPGYISANAGAFGGRWISADHIDPSRIAMYVPRGQYKALHIIAAADGEPDKVPVITAQFYRPNAGHPINFSGTVPALTAQSAATGTIPVKLAGGGTGRLYHVVIPLDPGAFDWLSDLDRIGLEITKAVQFYRAYPDPVEYSWHGAGLPSSVHIYAMSLERAGADIKLEPDHIGHVWTAPEKPGYSFSLLNNGPVATSAKLEIHTLSYDGKDKTSQDRTVELPAGGAPVQVQIPLSPTSYGLHELSVICTVNGETFTHRRNFAYLHADTRERGNWVDGKGPQFGYFGWGGGWDTPDKKTDITVMGQAGAETSLTSYGTDPDPDVRALAGKYQITAEQAFTYSSTYLASFGRNLATKFNPEDPIGSGQALVDQLKTIKIAPGPINFPTYMAFFPEPIVLPNLTSGIYPYHYNGPAYVPTKEDERIYNIYLSRFLIGAPAVRKEWPDVKILMPYGDPMNTAIFLERSPETRGLIDGVALDLPNFERLPEQQVNQVVMNRLYPVLQDVKKYLKNPYLMMIEGPSISSKDIDTSELEKGDVGIRNFLVLLGYGVNRHPSANASFECAGAWGENHYGGGYMSRKPLAMPEIAYVGYATLTRHLNRANFTEYVPTGSTSTYCQQFKHYKTGALVHVLWTIRGKRPVSVKVDSGATVTLYDQNDNATPLKAENGHVTFTIDSSPCYLEGLTADADITLGESDHSDSQPAKENAQLANLGDGSWKVVEKEDQDYAKNKPLQIERFLGKMSAQSVDAPKEQGDKALALHLEKQEVDRGVMPYYTTLEPAKPIMIPGKASHLGLWVHASSDWGRVVYVLRDAKGTKWISVGTRAEWNNDDIHCWSSFCFDGWRYLRFELPSSAPYDCYREYGTTWWGSYGGDGTVELPLKLEKIIVERRPEVIYGNTLVPAKSDDVLLASLNAEYTHSEDKTDEAVRLSKLRMPVPAGIPELSNPVAELAKTGVGLPTMITRIADPAEQADGTSGTVDFTAVADAKNYDIWVSPYPDGRGALQLGKAWTESGKLIRGLRPNMPLYAFIVYTDHDGKVSKPSEPFKFTLSDQFNYK